MTPLYRESKLLQKPMVQFCMCLDVWNSGIWSLFATGRLSYDGTWLSVGPLCRMHVVARMKGKRVRAGNLGVGWAPRATDLPRPCPSTPAVLCVFLQPGFCIDAFLCPESSSCYFSPLFTQPSTLEHLGLLMSPFLLFSGVVCFSTPDAP